MIDYGIRLDSLEEAIKDVSAGRFVVILDHPSREGEGDFIAAAAKVTPDMINFMTKYARGAFIATFITENIANTYNLPPQIPSSFNEESSRTNFRLTADTRYGKSGCSAAERAQTANILGGRFVPYECKPALRYSSENDLKGVVRSSTSQDLVRPGHVVPIVANPGGLYARQGHTESGVGLMELANISPPVAVDMEILNPDGTMAKPKYIRRLADKHNIKVISIGQLCEHLGISVKVK
ncbi:MAG: 3,4-dihydroxy-2-butanone-4-phosphate synthase [Nanoarchaeota archaeon]